MKVAITIPAHNEAKAIGALVAAVRDKGFDAVVIDDGSADKTGEIARAQGATVIINDPRLGKGASLKRGFDYAIQHGYDGVVVMDGDGQHAVEDLDRFMEKARTFPDSIITGNRMNDIQKMPLIRLWTNRFMSGMISFICRQAVPDTQCGYRYIGTKILQNIELSSRDFEIETEVLVKASKKGFKIFSVPVKTIYGDQVSKIRPMRDTLRFIRYMIKEMVRP